jgi:Ni,Fe-hydrogenase III large subunit
VPRASGDSLFETPVGPIHAGIIEPGHFRFTQAGENVLHLEARLFYTHRGVEKAMEGRTVSQALHGVERVCGACSVTHCQAYCQALKTLCRQKIRLAPLMLRHISWSEERLYNHLAIRKSLRRRRFSRRLRNGSRMKEDCPRWNELLPGTFSYAAGSRGVAYPGYNDKDQQELLQFLGQLKKEGKKLH